MKGLLPMNEFLTSRQILDRYKISDMSLWRWLQDPELGFPQPTIIRKRRYWSADAIAQWERSRAKTVA
jgi:predicted DNA-binding transcriptional regulator AlpA